MPRVFTSLVLFALVAANAATKNSATPTYERDVRPILKANCFQCHGEGEKLKGDLDVRLRQLIAKGGEHGAAIVAGKPEQSLIFKQVRDGEMPKGDRKKLTKAEIETIRQWIAGGGFKAGCIYGATDEWGHKAVENIVNHYDYHATLLHVFGSDAKKLTYKRNGADQVLVENSEARIVREILRG